MNRILAHQLALDYCCSPDEVLGGSNVFTVFEPVEGRRRYRGDGDRFLSIAAAGGKLLFTGREDIIAWCRQRYKDSGSEWSFEFRELYELERKTEEYGYRIKMVHPFYISEQQSRIPDHRYQIVMYRDREIEQFRGDDRWEEAYCFFEGAPDRIGAAAVVNGEIAGMAGASADSIAMWQIGINVLPKYRGRGIAETLVMTVKNEVLARGKLPFYGTSMSHIASQRVAHAAGFLPAWAELGTEKIPEDQLSEAADNEEVSEET